MKDKKKEYRLRSLKDLMKSYERELNLARCNKDANIEAKAIVKIASCKMMLKIELNQ